MSVQEIETAIHALPAREQAELRRRLAVPAPSPAADLWDNYRDMAQDAEHEADALAWAGDNYILAGLKPGV